MISTSWFLVEAAHVHVLYIARHIERVMRDSDSLARLEGGKCWLAARARMMDTNIALELAHRLQNEATLPIDWEDGKRTTPSPLG